LATRKPPASLPLRVFLGPVYWTSMPVESLSLIRGKEVLSLTRCFGEFVRDVPVSLSSVSVND